MIPHPDRPASDRSPGGTEPAGPRAEAAAEPGHPAPAELPDTAPVAPAPAAGATGPTPRPERHTPGTTDEATAGTDAPAARSATVAAPAEPPADTVAAPAELSGDEVGAGASGSGPPGRRGGVAAGAVAVLLVGGGVAAIGLGLDAPVAGILAGTVATVALAVAALVALARTPQPGRGLAIAGICLGAVGTVAVAVAGLVVVSRSPGATPAPAPVARSATAGPAPAAQDDRGSTRTPPRVYIDAVAVGQCYQVGSTGTVSTVVVVACSAAHDRELLGRGTLPPRPYPGDAAVDRDADRLCRPLFARYVGRDVTRSVLSYTWTAPGRAAWVAGNRRINCAGADPAGKRLTGSVRDSRR